MKQHCIIHMNSSKHLQGLQMQPQNPDDGHMLYPQRLVLSAD